METHEFSSAIESLLEIHESNFGNDASEIVIMDDAQFEIPLYDVTTEGFYPEPENSLENTMCALQHSAFTAYIKPHSNAATDSSVSSHTLHKRCFRFLRKIDDDRKSEIQRSRLTPPALARNNKKEPNPRKRNQPKTAAFNHMIAERNRRIKLNEHFQNLYSLLPRSCKKDKHTILGSITSYLRELKDRVRELEQQNESVDESIPRIFLNSEGGSGGFQSQEPFISSSGGSDGFESHEKHFNSASPLLYCSDDVILEQCDDIPCQVKITINVQMRMVSCSASLLVRVIDLLRAQQLEILSFSHKKGFGFEATFVVLQKGDDWDISHWQAFGSLVSRTLN